MGKKILIIEDDPQGMKALRDYLRAYGYHVLAASNGADGVELAREAKPDVVLCDVLLPRKSGFEVCFELKRESEGTTFPVVLMSAVLGGEPEMRYAADLRADGFFVKPFSMAKMRERIEQILSA